MHSTDNIDDGYLGSGKILRYSINKYGVNSHKKDIIEICPTREELKLREKKIVNEQLLADPLNINLKYGGEGGSIVGWNYMTTAARKQLGKRGGAALAKSGNTSWKDKSVRLKTVETRKSKGYNTHWIDKKHSPETKKKMSISHQGKHSGPLNSQFGVKRFGIHKDGVIKKVLPTELDSYLSSGWKKGFK
jgi:hypothetical protein